MVEELTKHNARRIINQSYQELLDGKRYRFTFWVRNKNHYLMFKMKRNSKGFFLERWEWLNSNEGYKDKTRIRIPDKPVTEEEQGFYICKRGKRHKDNHQLTDLKSVSELIKEVNSFWR